MQNNSCNNFLGSVQVTQRTNFGSYYLTANSPYCQIFTGDMAFDEDQVILPQCTSEMVGKQFMIALDGAFAPVALDIRDYQNILLLSLDYGSMNFVTFTCMYYAAAADYVWVCSSQNNRRSFVPSVTFSTPGDLSISYADRTCNYYSSNNLGFLDLKLRFTPTYTTASGNIIISPIPVAFNDFFGTFSMYNNDSINYPAGVTNIIPELDADISGNRILLNGVGSGIANTLLSTAEFLTGVEYSMKLQFTVPLSLAMSIP